MNNHIIVCKQVFFCEDETFTITPRKEDLGDHSTYNDLRNLGRGKQRMLVHEDGDVGTTQQNKNAII
jgi:hypothetical protein